MMLLDIVNFWRMTRRTDLVTRPLKFRGVRIMTINTLDPSCIHFALQKRSININFPINLAVRLVMRGQHRLWSEVIQEDASRPKAICERRSQTVTGKTGFHRDRGSRGPLPMSDGRTGRPHPTAGNFSLLPYLSVAGDTMIFSDDMAR